MQGFLWALGYIAIGGGLWDDGLHPDQRLKVEGLYLVNHALHTNHPPVRSLQSFTYEAIEKNGDPALQQCFVGNPTFSKLSGLEFVKDSCSVGKFYQPFGKASGDFHFVGAQEEVVISYFFTTCLALIEEKVIVENSSDSHAYNNAVLFHSDNLAAVDSLMEHLLRE